MTVTMDPRRIYRGYEYCQDLNLLWRAARPGTSDFTILGANEDHLKHKIDDDITQRFIDEHNMVEEGDW